MCWILCLTKQWRYSIWYERDKLLDGDPMQETIGLGIVHKYTAKSVVKKKPINLYYFILISLTFHHM